MFVVTDDILHNKCNSFKAYYLCVVIIGFGDYHILHAGINVKYAMHMGVEWRDMMLYHPQV